MQFIPGMQSWFNIWKSVISSICYQIKKKKKSQFCQLIQKKHFLKFNIQAGLKKKKKKPISKPEIERNFFNLTKGIHIKPVGSCSYLFLIPPPLSLSFCLLRAAPEAMEVPRLGVESEL